MVSMIIACVVVAAGITWCVNTLAGFFGAEMPLTAAKMLSRNDD